MKTPGYQSPETKEAKKLLREFVSWIDRRQEFYRSELSRMAGNYGESSADIFRDCITALTEVRNEVAKRTA